jgi:feruloyl esterase
MVQKAALAACDADDGVNDGIIGHPPACRFDPVVLQCKGRRGRLPHRAAVAAICAHAGPKNAHGKTDLSQFSGQRGADGRRPWDKSRSVATTSSRAGVQPAWNFRSFDRLRHPARADYGSNALDISRRAGSLLQGGRKLLLARLGRWLIPAVHGELLRGAGEGHGRSRGERRAIVHGARHGALRWWRGPVGDWLAPSTNGWKPAPERVLASNLPNQSPRTRPLCPHPQVAKYKGQGSTDEAQNFSCAKP